MRQFIQYSTLVMLISVAVYAADINAILDSSDGSSALNVQDAGSNDLMKVMSNGQIGVGKNPSVAVDVNGTVMASNFVGNGAGLYNLPAVPIDNIVWVGQNGTVTGPGTIEKPFSQPQDAYNFAMGVYPASPAAVVIAAGSYSGLVMTANNVHVYGLSRPRLVSLTVNNSGSSVMGKVRVDNLATFNLQVNGSEVKFHRIRTDEGTMVNGTAANIEFQDCFITTDFPSSALLIASGANGVAFYNSGIESAQMGFPTIDIQDGVEHLEFIGCEIVMTYSNTTAIQDGQINTIKPLHLYSHNYIKAEGDAAAIQDSALTNASTIAFHQNLVYGDVGGFPGGKQRHSNNSIYGILNWGAPDGGGMTDAYGNAIFNKMRKPPDSWDD